MTPRAMNRLHALIHRLLDGPLLNSPFMPLTNWWAGHIWDELDVAMTSQQFHDRLEDLIANYPTRKELERLASMYHNDSHVWATRARERGWRDE